MGLTGLRSSCFNMVYRNLAIAASVGIVRVLLMLAISRVYAGQ